jgi:pyridoxine kinase
MTRATQKQVAAIHDISGFGRCSLTVALPSLSAAGIQTSVIPTASLSTHTGGFTGFTYRDLSDDILPTAEQWNELGLMFDAIYTGFIGSPEQVDLVMKAIGILRSPKTMIIVDPVMADFGKLYSIFDIRFPLAMRKLCAMADVIVPNLTEAALMREADYREGPFTEDEVREMIMGLTEEHTVSHDIVLTGVSYVGDPGTIGAVSYDAGSGEFSYAGEKRIDSMCHGTGDVFASVLTAALVNGKPLAEACKAAVRYTVDSISRTKEAGTDNRYGVDFESGLDGLRSLVSGD